MTLPPHVHPFPKWLQDLPYIRHIKGCLFLTQIYLRHEIYHNLISDHPTHKNIALLIHEQSHYHSLQSRGLIPFTFRYILTRSGRFAEELAAYTKQIRYLKQHGQTYNLKSVAQLLSSGPYYFWCTDYDTALAKLQQAWDNA